METNPKKQRQHFYRDYASGQWSMSELCDRYQISRPTGYKCRPVFVSVAKLGGSVSLPIRAQNTRPTLPQPWIFSTADRRGSLQVLGKYSTPAGRRAGSLQRL